MLLVHADSLWPGRSFFKFWHLRARKSYVRSRNTCKSSCSNAGATKQTSHLYQECRNAKKEKDKTWVISDGYHLALATISMLTQEKLWSDLILFPNFFPFDFCPAAISQHFHQTGQYQYLKWVHLELSQQLCWQKWYTCKILTTITTTTTTNQPSENDESQMWWWHLQAGGGGAGATMWCKRGAAFSSSGLSSDG